MTATDGYMIFDMTYIRYMIYGFMMSTSVYIHIIIQPRKSYSGGSLSAYQLISSWFSPTGGSNQRSQYDLSILML